MRQTNACPQACRTHVEERLADIEYCESANQDAIGKKCPDWRELCAKVCVTTKTVARSGRLIKLETRDKYLDTDSACRSSPNGSGRLIFWCRSLSGIGKFKRISLMLLIANSILCTRCSYRQPDNQEDCLQPCAVERQGQWLSTWHQHCEDRSQLHKVSLRSVDQGLLQEATCTCWT